MSPEPLAEIQPTDDGVTVSVARQRKAILGFLQSHPGEYFRITDFNDGRIPGSSWDSKERLFVSGLRDEDPMWWLNLWRDPRRSMDGSYIEGTNSAPKDFEILPVGDPRRDRPDWVVGFVGPWSYLRVGLTKADIESIRKLEEAETDATLEEVYQFLLAHRGKAFTQAEIKDALAPRPRRFWPFWKDEEPKTPRGIPRSTLNLLDRVAYWAYLNNGRLLYKDMIGVLHSGHYRYGIAEVA
jgi:hypothetical protein